MSNKKKDRNPLLLNATVGDVEDAKEQLGETMESNRTALMKEMGDMEVRLQEVIEALTERCGLLAKQEALEQGLADSKQFTNSTAETLRSEAVEQRHSVDSFIKSTEASLMANLEKLAHESKKELVASIQGLANSVGEDMDQQRNELNKQIHVAADDALKNLTDKAEELHASIAKASQCAADNLAEYDANLHAELKERDRVQDERDVEQDELFKRTSDNISKNIEDLDEFMRSSLHELDNKFTLNHDTITKNFTQFKAATEKHREYCDATLDRLLGGVNETENNCTKKVDWLISNISTQLRPENNDATHRSIFSPKFDMSGCHGLQLELQYFPPSGIPGEEAGDAAVFLWASRGTTVNCRLYIGTRYQSIDKVFHGRMPFGTRRLCFLRDHIDREADSLRLSIEVLEAHRKVEHLIESKNPDKAASGAEAPKIKEGNLFFHRHINNRLLEQVQDRVDLLQSRIVRRAEWKVSHANQLIKCFPPGECLCSPQFQVAGVDGLQLVLYPSGYSNATEGFAALFLYAPAGATLHFTLHLGDQKREANHYYEEDSAYGRTSFCKLEPCIDADGTTLRVAVEMKEAHQDMHAKANHPGFVDESMKLNQSGPNAVSSIVKLKSVMGPSTGEGHLEEWRILPSLWTRAMKGSSTQAPDGFHKFEELAPKGPAKSPTGSKSPAGADRTSKSFTRANSTATMRSSPKGSPFGGYDDLAPPLPQLSKTGISQMSKTMSSFKNVALAR